MMDTGGNDMKSVLIALVLLFALAAPACGEWVEGSFEVPSFAIESPSDEWTKQDTCWQLFLTGLIAFDLYQTDLAVKNGGSENGPFTFILGEYPSSCTCFVGALLAAGTNYYIARILPQPYRRLFQLGIIGMESYFIKISWGTTLVF
jgi:hypothetical protein